MLCDDAMQMIYIYTTINWMIARLYQGEKV